MSGFPGGILFLLPALLAVGCAGTSAREEFGFPEENIHRIDGPDRTVPDGRFRFLVVGDTQNPRPGRPQNHPVRRAVFDRLAEALADSVPVFHAGDFVDRGNRRDEWARFFDSIFWDRLSPAQKRRFFPVPGNHEYKTRIFDYGGGDLGLYYAHFPHLGGRRYYFFSFGNAAFVLMDSGRNGIAGLLGGERWQNGIEEQLDWLDQVVFPFLLRRADETGLKRIFLFFHKPAYATPVQVNNRQSLQVLEKFEAFNHRSGYWFEIYAFSGHIHTFSHFAGEYGGRGRIDQFTTGGGGGTQRGSQYYRKVKRVEDLDLYRAAKYRSGLREGRNARELFDRVRLDDTLFGYLEVRAGRQVEVLYHRCDPSGKRFWVDYDFVR